MNHRSLTNPSCTVESLVIDSVAAQTYDIVLASVGYESRSRYFFQKHRIDATKRLAFAFPNQNTLAFQDNLSFYDSNGFTTDTIECQMICERIIEEAVSLSSVHDNVLRICVDVSSMSRFRMASVIEAAIALSEQREVAVDFVYCVAEYSPPPLEPTVIESADPVSPYFAGWTTRPDAPTCAIFGVGYEPDRVIGAIEYMEPGQIRAFLPIGPDPRFLDEVMRVNEPLWEEIPKEHRTRYSLSEPLNTFVRLESLLYSLKQTYRPILIPFGPKIFTVQCLLASIAHFPSVAVWRVTGGSASDPIDRRAGGEIYAIRGRFIQRDTS